MLDKIDDGRIDDFDLLRSMLDDEQKQSAIYRPGPFWRKLAEDAASRLKETGLSDFRGYSAVAFGFADCINIDVNKSHPEYTPTFLDHLAMRSSIFRRLQTLFGEQQHLTACYELWMRDYLCKGLLRNPRTPHLLAKYKLADTLRFGCQDFVEIDGSKYARHYLKLLDQHDYVAQKLDFGRIRSVFEIGGGFGINTHILMQNYPNIRKFLYLDIPPNLYVGTQYLRALYPGAVKDYRDTRTLKTIKFSSNDSLEIIAISSWQIERCENQIDLFYNAHSFAEIPEDAVRNYVKHIERLLTPDGSIALLTYDCPPGSPVLPADDLPTFFAGRAFEKQKQENLDFSQANFFYTSGA